MALLDLIFGGKTKAEIGVIQLDASITETHTSELELTEFPVEVGVDLADHAKMKPGLLAIHGMITNHPIVFLASINAPSPITTDKLAVTDRVTAAHEKFLELQRTATELDIVTSLINYSNRVIVSLVVTREAKSGNILDFMIVLREIQKSETQETARLIPENPYNNKPEDKGKVKKKPASDSQTDKGSSTLSGLTS